MTTPRLTQQLLPGLSGIGIPQYDRSTLRPGILHLGVGAFHRAHQAVYIDDILNTIGGDWGIVGASLRTPAAQTQLEPQNCLYTVNTLAPHQVERRVVGAIVRIIAATDADGFNELMHTIANPAIHLLTITVTEKGYCLHNDNLDESHPDVIHDRANTTHKRSLPGVLASGLAARRAAGAGPITVLSCDNLASNGRVLERIVRQYLALTSPTLIPWLNRNTSFPNTMIDRIVPSSDNEVRNEFAAMVGFADQAMVRCEPFRQWVIEDNFIAPRPPLENAGVLLVDNVEPYERAKLSLLNGPHSACAYIGILLGCDYVHEVMQHPLAQQFITRLVGEEILPCVQPLPDLNLTQYATTIFARFANPAILYSTRQVGTDGSQKLAQRLVPIVRQRLQAGLPITHLALVFAAWLEHLSNPAPDPLNKTLQDLRATYADPDQLLHAIHTTTSIWHGLDEVFDKFAPVVSQSLALIRGNSFTDVLQQIAQQAPDS